MLVRDTTFPNRDSQIHSRVLQLGEILKKKYAVYTESASVKVHAPAACLYRYMYTAVYNKFSIHILLLVAVMPRLSIVARRTAVLLRTRGLSVSAICASLTENGHHISRAGLYNLFRKYDQTKTIADKPRAAKKKNLQEEQLEFIDATLRHNDEVNATSMKWMIEEKWPHISFSRSSVRRAQREKGWTASKAKYCQMIRNANYEKRLLWCKQCLQDAETFDDVIFSDESTVVIDNHGRLCFRKIGEPKQLNPRPKHPASIHIWGGISKRGATNIVLFSGIMDSIAYRTILETGLLPFIARTYPDHHRFQQDNDPKHTSKLVQEYLLDKKINWWKIPAESLDLNPIENVWGSMKTFLRETHKPKDLESLKTGIISCFGRKCHLKFVRVTSDTSTKLFLKLLKSRAVHQDSDC